LHRIGNHSSSTAGPAQIHDDLRALAVGDHDPRTG
jgi:hypothetical protein